MLVVVVCLLCDVVVVRCCVLLFVVRCLTVFVVRSSLFAIYWYLLVFVCSVASCCHCCVLFVVVWCLSFFVVFCSVLFVVVDVCCLSLLTWFVRCCRCVFFRTVACSLVCCVLCVYLFAGDCWCAVDVCFGYSSLFVVVVCCCCSLYVLMRVVRGCSCLVVGCLSCDCLFVCLLLLFVVCCLLMMFGVCCFVLAVGVVMCC